MTEDVVRILNENYDLTSPVTVYFKTTSSWTNEDMYAGNQPELRRKLRFQLTTIIPNNIEAYSGSTGVLVFDRTNSKGNSLPSQNYTYSGVLGVKIREGYTQIPLLTKDVTNGKGVPFQTRGLFSGTFTAIMVPSRTDLLGTTLDKIQKIYLTQSIGADLLNQNATVVLLHDVNNNESLTVKVIAVDVLEAGAGYTSAPNVVFSAVGGTPPTAFSKIEDGRVTGVVMTFSGSNLTSEPNVTFTGGGSPTTIATGVVEATGDTFKSFRTQSFMRIDNIFKDAMDEDVVKYTITGTLIKPSVFTEPT